MKKILFFFLLVLSITAHSQQLQPQKGFGNIWQRGLFQKTLHVPQSSGLPDLNDTYITQSAVAIDTANHLFYFYDGSTQTWNLVTGGIDTTIVRYPLGAIHSLDHHDTLIWHNDSLPQLRYNDTTRNTGGWVNRTLADKEYVDSMIGAATLTLQQAYDNDPTADPNIIGVNDFSIIMVNSSQSFRTVDSTTFEFTGVEILTNQLNLEASGTEGLSLNNIDSSIFMHSPTFKYKIDLDSSDTPTAIMGVDVNGFIHKYSAGGISTPSLQAVTDVDNLTDKEINSTATVNAFSAIDADISATIGYDDITGTSGYLGLGNSSGFLGQIFATNLTDNRGYELPDGDGPLALANNTPTISSGTSAPSSTPDKVGDIYVDTSAMKLYFSVANGSSADWIIAN